MIVQLRYICLHLLVGGVWCKTNNLIDHMKSVFSKSFTVSSTAGINTFGVNFIDSQKHKCVTDVHHNYILLEDTNHKIVEKLSEFGCRAISFHGYNTGILKWECIKKNTFLLFKRLKHKWSSSDEIFTFPGGFTEQGSLCLRVCVCVCVRACVRVCVCALLYSS
eukprot:GHVR01167434.1.p1 GENE.GHVR01167434.1~~GHVR01167434.1.p1  ORF type:complete len:164 (+),score=41.32 GHVR01167434.1:59-550(+)